MMAVLLAFVGGLVGVVIAEPRAVPGTVLDMVSAIIVLLPSIVFGVGLVNRLSPGDLPMRWKFVLGAALGLGSTSILVMIGGLFGLLQRPVWLSVGGLQVLAGLWGIRRFSASKPGALGFTPWAFLWLLIAPFITLALLSASNVPGLIWQEEGNGYDVLEYHLQLPREYHEIGRIEYRAHNVYSAFPANMEMLYLLAMILHRDAVDIGTTANMIHLFFALLAVVAAWTIGADISPRAGVVAGVLLAGCTWLEYLSGLAYVENGMLFYGLCSLGLMVRSGGGYPPQMSAAAGGLAAGLAAGCKYTAVPMLAIPCALICLCGTDPMVRRMRSMAIFTLCAGAAFAPWLAKNWATTGNPVFPLTNRWWNAHPDGWSVEQTENWNRAHSDSSGSLDRIKSLWRRVPGDYEQRFGPAILGLGLLGLAGRRRDRVDVALFGFLAFQVVVWLLATHLYARFAIPMLIPLGILGARAGAYSQSFWRSLVILGLMVAGSAWNFAFAVIRHQRESFPGLPASVFYEGQLPGHEFLGEVNQSGMDSKWLLVGEARAFYVRVPCDYTVPFNYNPFFANIVAGTSAIEIARWLRENRYTNVLVQWSEVRRIAGTYGFNPPMTEDRLREAMAALADHGVKRTHVFTHPLNPELGYVELYEVQTISGSTP